MLYEERKLIAWCFDHRISGRYEVIYNGFKAVFYIDGDFKLSLGVMKRVQ